MSKDQPIDKKAYSHLPIRFSKNPNANALSGIWKRKPLTIKELREKAWGNRL
jgi:hypothetical protein